MKTAPAYPSIELLESRIAPSTLTFLNPNSAKYTEGDGDTVVVKFTKGLLTMANFQQVLVMSTDSSGDHLAKIDLSAGTAGKVQGTGISVSVTPGGLGDGATTVGFINASGFDLAAVSIAGDLANITAGDAVNKTPAVASLSAQSIGRFGTTTGSASLQSSFLGALGKLTVAGDVVGASFSTVDPVYGKIGSVTIGGSLKVDANGGGSILSDGSIGAIKIGGSLQGGASGGQIQSVSGSIASVYIGGSVVGTTNGAGYIQASGIGAVTVVGSLMGGEITSALGIKSVLIGGSVVGGSDVFTGAITANKNIGSVTVGGSVTGGSAGSTGYITSETMIAKVSVGGSLKGGTVSATGKITAGVLGPVFIGGDVQGGTGTDTGEIWAFDGSLASLTVKGSCFSGTSFSFNGCVLTDGQLGPVSIGGDVMGKDGNPFLIRAKNGITSMTVSGSMNHGLVLSGYSTNNSAVNGGASIGAVKVGVDWVASSIVAGAKNSAFPAFGDGNDSKIAGSAVISKIASITIGGYLQGSAAAGDHFGFVAQQIGSFKLGSAVISLTPAAHTDDRNFTVAPDVTIHEV